MKLPAILVLHLAALVVCGASSIAFSILAGEPVKTAAEHAGMQVLAWGLIALGLTVLHVIYLVLSRLGKDEVHMMDLRFPVEDPGSTVAALRKSLIRGPAVSARTGEWTLVLTPMLPPVPEPDSRMWELSPTRLFDEPPGEPIRFGGAVAFREDEEAVRVMIFHHATIYSPFDEIGVFDAAISIQKAVFRLLSVIQPSSIPDFTRNPARLREAGGDPDPVLDVIRRISAMKSERNVANEISRIVALGVVAGGPVSVSIGTVLMVISGAKPLHALVAGIAGAFLSVLSWGAYRHAFRTRRRMLEILGNAPPPPAMHWREPVVFLLTLAPVFPVVLTAGSLLVQIQESIARTVSDEQTRNGFLLIFLLLVGITFSVICHAVYEGAAQRGWRDAEEFVRMES